MGLGVIIIENFQAHTGGQYKAVQPRLPGGNTHTRGRIRRQTQPLNNNQTMPRWRMPPIYATKYASNIQGYEMSGENRAQNTKPPASGC